MLWQALWLLMRKLQEGVWHLDYQLRFRTEHCMGQQIWRHEGMHKFQLLVGHPVVVICNFPTCRRVSGFVVALKTTADIWMAKIYLLLCCCTSSRMHGIHQLGKPTSNMIPMMMRVQNIVQFKGPAEWNRSMHQFGSICMPLMNSLQFSLSISIEASLSFALVSRSSLKASPLLERFRHGSCRVILKYVSL